MSPAVSPAVSPARLDVVLVNFDPTIGSEIQKTRPAVVVSPDELNSFLPTVIVVPLTSTTRAFPFRVRTTFEGQAGSAALDQIRTISTQRIIKPLGAIDPKQGQAILDRLQEMFHV